MTFAILKSGGTQAGRRHIKAPREVVWFHECDSGKGVRWQGHRPLESCYTRCPDCGTRRP